jgi:anti-sigma factor RsiW
MTQPPLPYYPAPAGLRERVQSAIRRPVRRGPRREVLWALGLAATLLLSIGTWSFGAAGRANDAELQMVLDGHLRSLAPGHLTDVTSTDQHTVKPWFAGKLDFSPPVVDPASAGYPLVGGRVDVVAGLPTAALVYSRRSHIINLFIRPTDRVGTGPARESVRRGYNIVTWSASGMQLWAVSDLNLEELREFQKLVAHPATP